MTASDTISRRKIIKVKTICTTGRTSTTSFGNFDRQLCSCSILHRSIIKEYDKRKRIKCEQTFFYDCWCTFRAMDGRKLIEKKNKSMQCFEIYSGRLFSLVLSHMIETSTLSLNWSSIINNVLIKVKSEIICEKKVNNATREISWRVGVFLFSL
jgi:hypothetical protein